MYFCDNLNNLWFLNEIVVHFYKDIGEVTFFIINFFLLQVVGRMLVKSILILFRFFGMPQLHNWFYSIPNATHWLSTFLLLIAVMVSIVRITRKNKRKKTMQKDDNGMEENEVKNDE